MTIMERHASATTYVGSGTALLGGISANELAAYCGIAIGLAGLLINWYYKAKEDRRAERALQCKP